MEQSVLIRGTEPGDYPALAEVFNQPRVIWGTLQSPYTSLDARRKRFDRLPDADRTIVAVLDGKVVGMAGLHTVDNRRRAHTASIGMAVHDGYTGRGAGKALLAALIELADGWMNFKRLELTVWTDNARAIDLYEKAGFEREGVMRAYGWRDGAYADVLAMARLSF